MGDERALTILYRTKFYQHNGTENSDNSQTWEFTSRKDWISDGDA